MDNRFDVFLCELRKEKNLTQKELAELIHVSPSTVSKWEKGIARPNIALYEHLAKVLNVSSLELFYCKRGVDTSPALCLDEMNNAIRGLIQADEKRNKKVFIQKIMICVLVILLLLSLFFSGYLYYHLPPRMDIVDEFYDEAPEALPYDKVYCVIVDYDGRITLEDTIKYPEQIRSFYKVYFSDVDAIMIKYCSNYKGREFTDDYYAMSVMLPNE